MVLQGYDTTSLLGATTFYIQKKPQCFLVLRGSNLCLHKLCCNHSKMQGEILTSLRHRGSSKEFDGGTISRVMALCIIQSQAISVRLPRTLQLLVPQFSNGSMQKHSCYCKDYIVCCRTTL